MHKATHAEADLVNRVGYSSPKLVSRISSCTKLLALTARLRRLILRITAARDHLIVGVTYLRATFRPNTAPVAILLRRHLSRP